MNGYPAACHVQKRGDRSRRGPRLFSVPALMLAAVVLAVVTAVPGAGASSVGTTAAARPAALSRQPLPPAARAGLHAMLHKAGPVRTPLSRAAVHPLAGIAPAHIFTVNSTVDANNTAAANTAHECKDAAGKCTLRAAVDAANADPGQVDKIVVPAGTYTLSLGVLEPTNSMLITGAGASLTTISGAGTYEIFEVDTSSSDPISVEIDKVTLVHGNESYGGAVYLGGYGTLTLGADVLADNTAEYGGAVAQENFDSSLWISNSVITANSAEYDGGGLYLDDGAAQLSDDAIGASKGYPGNRAGEYGGGVDIADSIVSMIDTSVARNAVLASGGAGDGGGVYNDEVLSMQGGSISYNSVSASSHGYGGGLYNDYEGQYDGVVIDDNSVTAADGGGGGGVYNDDSASFVNSTADDNTIKDSGTGDTDEGGGVYNDGEVLWTGGAISGNSIQPIGRSAGLDGDGGGVYEDDTTTITGAAISDNSVVGQTTSSTSSNEYEVEGGAVYSDGSLHLSHDTLEGNSASDWEVYGGAVCYEDDDSFSVSYLDIGHTTTKAVDYVEGGEIYADGNFALTNSTIHDNSVTVTEPTGGGIEGGFGYFEGYLDLDSVTLTNQTNTVKATSGDPYVDYGIAYADDDAHIVNLAVSHVVNSATGTGGEIYGDFYADDNLELSGATVTSVTNRAGGGGYVEAGVFYLRDDAAWNNVTITHTTNLASGPDGHVDYGVAYLYEPANLDHTKVLSTTDTASGPDGYIEGGVFYVDENTTFVNFEIDNVTATVGNDGYIEGGAMYLDDDVTVDEATIANAVSTATSGATSYVEGGAVYAGDLANLTNVTLTGDEALSPGGGSDGARGGAIYAEEPVTLLNDTVNNDTAARAGGAVFSNGALVSFKNTIVTSTCVGMSGGPGFLSAGHNLGTGTSCRLTNIGDLNGHAKLGRLKANGGFVLTEAELAGSITIDAGSDNGCPAVDARGVARPEGKSCDIGAYEYVPPKKKA